MHYFIQYAAGTGDLILDSLPQFVDDIEILYQDDSAMIFDSPSKPASVAAIPFAKNAFVLIASTARGSIDRGVVQLSRILADINMPQLPGRNTAFRVMVHIDGELAPVDQRSKAALERVISAKTRARVEPRGMCQEYWVVGRLDMRELILCARLPKEARPPKAKGAISYELSSMLVAASRPHPQDVYLDPFAGSGSFIQARLGMPARQIFYSDRDLRLFKNNFPPEFNRDRRVKLLSDDALSLPSISDGHIDVIVTDPPWGEHEDIGMSYHKFAVTMANTFDRVLHPIGGRFVVLGSRREEATLEDGLLAASFTIHASHHILVNGHPATVLIGGR
jgi:hypothetical protein